MKYILGLPLHFSEIRPQGKVFLGNVHGAVGHVHVLGHGLHGFLLIDLDHLAQVGLISFLNVAATACFPFQRFSGLNLDLS